VSETQARAQRLIAMGERLADALDADIAALLRGKPGEMRLIAADVQQLGLNYSKESRGLDAKTARALPAETRARLSESTRRFRDALQRHQRVLARVRNASEGMIRAVAEEVERRRASTRTYGATPAGPRVPRPAQAMLYNGVA